MKSDIEVKPGQQYEDVDRRCGVRTLTVTRVELQDKTQGRFKARYTYATCVTSSGLKVKVDTDRLRNDALYRLVKDIPAVSVCGLNPEASTPQAEP